MESATLRYEAVVLAAGRGSRMGGVDKGLQDWRGKTLVEHVLQRLQRQSIEPVRIVINASRNLSKYQQFAEVVTDEVPGFDGPLRGVQAALRQCRAPYLLVVPCDSPNLPLELAQTLFEQAQGLPAFACCGPQPHPLTCLLPVNSLESLDRYLAQNQRQVRRWLAELQAVAVEFTDPYGFVNFNENADLQ